MANDHFVQRALINHWATDDKFVYIYDFADGSLVWRSTKSVFSKEGLNSEYLEKRVGLIIDDPLGKIAHEHQAYRQGGPVPTLIGENEAAWRAAAIVFATQIARSFDGKGETTDSLGMMMNMTDGQLSAYAQRFWDRHELGAYIMPPNVALFLPEMGTYMFPLFSEQFGASWVDALPIGPQTVLYAAPKGVKFEPNETAVSAVGNFSVGMGPLNSKLVVSPMLVETHGLEAMKSDIQEMRRFVNEQRDQVEKIRRLHVKMFARCGLEAPNTMPGLVGKPPSTDS
jgi:hypothetical protein